MNFTPLSEQELQSLSLLDEGKYKFKVLKTDHRTSQKSGNDYFNLKLLVISEKGQQRTIYDTLLFAGKMMYKTRHFCYATGLNERYESGELLPGECEGKEGELFIVKSTNRLTGEAQNSVRDYVMKDEVSSPVQFEPFSDALPF